MMIHEITEKVGKHKRRKRVGRGPASGNGKTAGRGHKGAKSRSGFGGSQPPGFAGGALPWFRRTPTRGFSNAKFAKDCAIVNLKTLEARFDQGDSVDAEALAEAGVLRDPDRPVKVLAQGELTKKLNVTADRFSNAARQKIEDAGGTCNVAER